MVPGRCQKVKSWDGPWRRKDLIGDGLGLYRRISLSFFLSLFLLLCICICLQSHHLDGD
jgi:hypothetical protein